MKSKLFLLCASVTISAASLVAQSSAPVVVQAVPPVTSSTAVAPAAPVQSGSDTMKLLEDLKAANDAILAKQAATLQQLEDLEKAAEQIKIYTKRG